MTSTARFNRAKKGFAFAFIFNIILTLAVVGFLGWVIVKVMQHFGVI